MKCESCGATVSPRDIKMGSCGYCNNPLKTAVDEAAKQAALDELLADRDGDGIPDALAAMNEKQQEQQQEQQRQAALQNKLATLRRLLELKQNARFRIRTLAIWSPILALILGTLWFFVVAAGFKADPWLGAHHRVFCPRVCEGCTGPYVQHSWTTTRMSGGSTSKSSTTLLYCRHKSTQIGALDWSKMDKLKTKHRPYLLRGGLWVLWFSSLLFWLLPSIALLTVLQLRSVRNAPVAAAALEKRIAELEGAEPPTPEPESVAPG